MNAVNTNVTGQNGDAVASAPIINFSGGTFGTDTAVCNLLPEIFAGTTPWSRATDVVNTLSALRSNKYQFHNWSNTLRACGYVLDVTGVNPTSKIECKHAPLAVAILICANAVPNVRMGERLYHELIEDLLSPEYKALESAIDALEIKLMRNQKLLDKGYVSDFRMFAAEAISSKFAGYTTVDVNSVHKATLLAHDAAYYWLANPFPDFLDRALMYQADLVVRDWRSMRSSEEIAENQYEQIANQVLRNVYDRLEAGQNVFYSPYSERYEAAARENLKRLLELGSSSSIN